MRPVAGSEERIGSTIPMPMFAGRPSTMNSSLPAEIPQNSMAHQQRLQISELQFVKISHTLDVFMLEDEVPNPGKLMFRFSLKLCYGSKKWENRRFGGRLKIIALN